MSKEWEKITILRTPPPNSRFIVYVDDLWDEGLGPQEVVEVVAEQVHGRSFGKTILKSGADRLKARQEQKDSVELPIPPLNHTLTPSPL
jgi:hypothetical protein